MTPLSILDLVRVTEETDARGALNNARDLAVHAEGWGYRRIWVAEHHNMPGIASAATSIVLAHIAEGTKAIRIGAGGIMLPNLRGHRFQVLASKSWLSGLGFEVLHLFLVRSADLIGINFRAPSAIRFGAISF